MSNNSSGNSISFFGVMFLIFMTLKLLGIITWSWWWVTAPLWGGLALAVLILVVVFSVLGIIRWLANDQKPKEESNANRNGNFPVNRGRRL